LLCSALLYFALLCFALLYFALLCSASLHRVIMHFRTWNALWWERPDRMWVNLSLRSGWNDCCHPFLIQTNSTQLSQNDCISIQNATAMHPEIFEIIHLSILFRQLSIKNSDFAMWKLEIWNLKFDV
jgi:hypothetical protein